MEEQGNTDPIIDMREDGPLLAKHLPKLMDRDGSELPPRPLAPLCRCGASGNKPYCDGSHRDVGFKTGGRADAEKDRVKAYTGQDVTVHYNPLLCSHAAECVRRGGGAFDPDARPWIDPDRAAVDTVREAVRACPSGALRISEPGAVGEPHHLEQGDELVVEVEPNGPVPRSQRAARRRPVAGRGDAGEIRAVPLRQVRQSAACATAPIATRTGQDGSDD